MKSTMDEKGSRKKVAICYDAEKLSALLELFGSNPATVWANLGASIAGEQPVEQIQKLIDLEVM